MYTEIFLATYRFFYSPTHLLGDLIAWFKLEAPSQEVSQEEKELFIEIKKNVQSRVLKIILTWIKSHWHDFHINKNLIESITTFTNDLIETNFSDSQKITQAMREQRLSWYTTQYIPLGGQRGRRINGGEGSWALNWQPDEFANQLTTIEMFLLSQMRSDSYLHLMRSKVPKAGGGNNVALKVVLESIFWFRMVCFYFPSPAVAPHNLHR